MNIRSLQSNWHVIAATVAATLIITACQTPQTASKPAPDSGISGAQGKGVTQPPPLPAAPPTPAEKAQSQKLALDALDQLQNGDESSARTTLDQALKMDPGNEVARKLMDQIKADAQQELGPAFFRYTVQSDDTLSKIAQRFLNDRYRFYILAKYNDLRVPNRLAAGQVIKIPGKEPPPTPTKAPSKTPEPPKPEPVQKTADPAPKPPEPTPKPAEVDKNKALIQRLGREAEACQRKQDLDCAIGKWDQVLLLDPDNQPAKLKREKAIELKKQLKEIK